MNEDVLEKIDFKDGKKRVLILGNGISRNRHKEIVDDWKGELWICNWAFREALSEEIPKPTVLIGDYKALKEAVKYRNKPGLRNTVFFGKSKKSTDLGAIQIPVDRNTDSGTTLVKYALNNDYEEIYLLGFDLGGKDLYIQDHHKKDKSMWIRSWRKIRDEHGLDRIYFIGKDHKEIIEGNYPDNYYALKYTKNKDHLNCYGSVFNQGIPEEHEQKNVKSSRDVVIVGSGKSFNVKKVTEFLKGWSGEIWACSYMHRLLKAKKIKEPDRIGTVHSNIVQDLRKETEYSKIYAPLFDEHERMYYFQDYRGFSTGPQLILQALYENYDKIYLVGFDCAGVDVWNKKLVNYRKVIEEMRTVMRERTGSTIRFIGYTPKFLV